MSLPKLSPSQTLLLCFVLCVSGFGGALGVQGIAGWQPCALCVLQRILLLGMAAIFAVGLSVRRLRLAALVTGGLLGLAGVGVASWQCWMVAHPVVACGADPLGLAINASVLGRLLPWVFDSYGNCSIVPAFLGVPLSGWSLALFLSQAGLLGASLWTRFRSVSRSLG